MKMMFDLMHFIERFLTMIKNEKQIEIYKRHLWLSGIMKNNEIKILFVTFLHSFVKKYTKFEREKILY